MLCIISEMEDAASSGIASPAIREQIHVPPILGEFGADAVDFLCGCGVVDGDVGSCYAHDRSVFLVERLHVVHAFPGEDGES